MLGQDPSTFARLRFTGPKADAHPSAVRDAHAGPPASGPGPRGPGAPSDGRLVTW